MHDPTKVLLGSNYSSDKVISDYNVDPATFVAGLAVRQSSVEGVVALAKATGMLVGVSLGKSLSNHKKTSVLRAGLQVPIILTDDEDDYAYVIVGAKVSVDDVTGKANIDDTVDVTTTITDATYASGPLTGIAEDGTEVMVALIDMPGGL
jgi:hypothetical protein